MLALEKDINGKVYDKESIVRDHEGLVHMVCQRYANWAALKGEDYDDIVSVGFIGLLQAFKRFDGERYNVQFSSYAVSVIRGTVQRHLNETDTLRYPRPVRDLAYKISSNDLDDEPIDKIADQIKEDRERVTHAVRYLKNGAPASLDFQMFNGEDKASMHDLVGTHDDTSSAHVREFLDALDHRERRIVEGLLNGETQREIAKSLGLKQPQVSRILKRIRVRYKASWM